MTRTQVSAIAFAFSTLFVGQAMAADHGSVTRDQVKTELAEAVRAGNMIVGESGERLNEVFPHNYPIQTSSSVSRAQVQAELAEAIRNGNVVLGESSAPLSLVLPQRYDQQNVASKSREQVRGELADAAASGQLDRRIEA
jgi:ribosomal protein L30E